MSMEILELENTTTTTNNTNVTTNNINALPK